MLRQALVLMLVVLPVSNLLAGGVDLRLGRKTAEFTFLSESATFGYGGADMGFGMFLNENDDFIAHGSILVSGSGDGDVRGLHFGVGGKIYGGVLEFPSPVENQNGGAIAIGGQIRYVSPGRTPIAFVVEVFGAPAVTSISDFEGLVEIRAALELEVTPSARAYIGWRSLEVELNNTAEIEVDEEGHVGVRFSF